MEWRLQDSPYLDRIEVFVYDRTHVAKPAVLEFDPRDEGALIEPCLELDHDAAQQLMNELWKIGIRPKDGSGTVAHVDSMKAHLEDMRRLVFKDE